MTESLKAKCESFIKARDILKENFKMENMFIYPVCASLFVNKGIEPAAETLRKCNELINKETSLFSNFRGTVKLPLICMMAVSEDPEEKLASAIEMYGMLKKEFHGSQYLALTAMLLTDIIKPDSAERYIERGKAIYNGMSREHPWVTSGEDNVFAVLCAFSELSDGELIEEMERAFKILKKPLDTDSNSAQTLSHIIVLSEGDTEEKCEKVLTLYKKIKEKGMKYSKYFEMAVLAGAAMLPVDTDALVNEIAEADGFLSKQPGYTGFIGLDRKTRAMHAVMLASSEHADKAPAPALDNSTAVAFTGTMYNIAMQQAMMCAIAASSAANIAAHSSN